MFLNGAAGQTRREQLGRLLATTAGSQPNCLLVRDRVVFVRPHAIDWVEADAD